MPFHPHKEAAALDLGAGVSPAAQHQQGLDSEGELGRVVATLQDIRSATYQTLDHVSVCVWGGAGGQSGRGGSTGTSSGPCQI
jgi:hypothetical protein